MRPAEGYGDWLSIKADTPKDVLGTAYFAYSTHLTAEAARVLGKEDDARKYAGPVRGDQGGVQQGLRRPRRPDQGQHADLLRAGPLSISCPRTSGRWPPSTWSTTSTPATGCLSTGFVGTSMLMPVLAQTGHQDVAYRLLLNDTFPSWGFSIKHGATSIWERWDGWTAEKGFQDPGMNSFAHYSFGAVARWMFQTRGRHRHRRPGLQAAPDPPAARSGALLGQGELPLAARPDRHGVEDGGRQVRLGRHDPGQHDRPRFRSRPPGRSGCAKATGPLAKPKA